MTRHSAKTVIKTESWEKGLWRTRVKGYADASSTTMANGTNSSTKPRGTRRREGVMCSSCIDEPKCGSKLQGVLNCKRYDRELCESIQDQRSASMRCKCNVNFDFLNSSLNRSAQPNPLRHARIQSLIYTWCPGPILTIDGIAACAVHPKRQVPKLRLAMLGLHRPEYEILEARTYTPTWLPAVHWRPRYAWRLIC